jgi:hypothetical protein
MRAIKVVVVALTMGATVVVGVAASAAPGADRPAQAERWCC